MVKSVLSIGMSAAMGAALLVGTSAPAPAATVKACVKKSTGQVRILATKKKCKKGWKKVSWDRTGATGPQGQQGTAGPAPAVKDGNGNVIGAFRGMFPGGYSFFYVEVNGGIYLYSGNGQVLPLASSSPYFTNASCNSAPFMQASSALTEQLIVGSAGGPSRLIFRVTSPTLGATRAYAFTANAQSINQAVWKWDSSGNCMADGVYNGRIVFLQEVPAPQDVTGPLTVG